MKIGVDALVVVIVRDVEVAWLTVYADDVGVMAMVLEAAVESTQSVSMLLVPVRVKVSPLVTFWDVIPLPRLLNRML